jgi:signal transduction histidine kinase/CheY-like chemotaxis protein
MRITAEERNRAGAPSVQGQTPKPYSMERRFRLMQAGTVTLAFFLISSVLYWNWSVRDRLGSSVRNLHSRLELDAQIHSSHELAAEAFWEAYYSERKDPRPDYAAHVREVTRLLHVYTAIPLSGVELSEVDALRGRETRFFTQTARLLTGTRKPLEDAAQIAEVDELGRQIEVRFRSLEELQIQRLEHLNAQIEQFSLWMTLLLLLLAAFVLLATITFRYVHRRHLWVPIEQLRRMVTEVRRGNLNVSGEIPQSVELGSLVSAFLAMAGEVRDVRESLEKKVIERTTKLEETQSELLQSAKLASLGQLVSGVAHEINNPLTSILGFSEIILSRFGEDPSVYGPLRTIRDEALRLRQLVANLSSFARRAPHRTQRIDLRSVLLRLADLRDYQLQANNISLHLECPAAPVWVVADPDQLLQVLVNLVLNSERAIKDCRERGDIWLGCGAAGRTAWLSVKDNGVGVPSEVRKHIFDPFFTTKPPGEGTGLGLSISYGIIQQHQGTIAVETRPGKGTTMRVTLPVAPEEVAHKPPLASSGKLASESRAASAKWHVLVIDDEPDILEMISHALERMDCRTTLLRGAERVPAALEQDGFDLVLCDLKMPGQTGLEMYRLIREKRHELAKRFVLMTGNLIEADQHAAEFAGVPILPKPFTLARLREAVGQILNGQAST